MTKIAIIGLGYVGLPLAVEFAKKYEVVGFDINKKRLEELRQGIDSTLELTKEQLLEVVDKERYFKDNSTLKVKNLIFTDKLEDIEDCNIYIVTVPTPIDKNRRPDLTPLIKARESIGKVLKKDDIVIYESTVYPGATEEECVPVLERVSGLKYINSKFNIQNSTLNEVRNTHINIGTGVDVSIKELALIIKDIVGYKGELYLNETKPDGTMKKVTDISKLNKLGWKYKVKLEDGIKIMYKWYLENLND